MDLLSGGLYLMDDLAEKIVAPTLTVWGAEDRICHISTVDTIMSKIDRCCAYILHRCGHIPMIEYPLLSGKIYGRFLRQIDSGGSIHG